MALSSFPRHAVSVGDSLVICCRDGSRRWRSASVVATDGEGACEVVYEDDGGKEWVDLHKVKYALRRGARKRKRGRAVDGGEEEEKSGGCYQIDKGENQSPIDHRVRYLSRKCMVSSKTSPHAITSDYLPDYSNESDSKIGATISTRSRSTRLKKDFKSCTEKDIGKTDLASCRRSRRLQQKLTSAYSSRSENSFEKVDLASPLSLGSSCPSESETNAGSVSDESYQTSESSDMKDASSGSSLESLCQPRRRLRSQNNKSNVSRKMKSRMGNSTYRYPSPQEKMNFSGAKGGKHLKGSMVSKASDGDHSVDEHCVAEFYAGLHCSICQIRVAGDFLIQCIRAECRHAFHTFCLHPCLMSLEQDWLCPYCKEDSFAAARNGSEAITRRLQRIVGHRRINSMDGQKYMDHQFLIKWESLNHHHDSWVPREWLFETHRRQLFGYEKNNPLREAAEIDQRKPEWFRIDRVIACRKKGNQNFSSDFCNTSGIDKVNGDYEFLVKWVGLDYCDVTWESSWTEELHTEVDRFLQRHERAAAKADDHFLRSKICHFVESPDYLKGGILYDYQLEGLNWILRNFTDRRNVILADEMGLGKTIQVVSFLQCMKQENFTGHPFLIIAPKSILFHWEKEFHKWAEGLNVVIYHGDKTSRSCIKLHEFFSSGRNILFDVIVTNYEMVLIDNSVLRKFKWSAIVIDEGHKIKNLQCKLARHLKHYASDFRLLLTGTPLQNTLLELFALLHFLDPEEFSDPVSEAESFSNIGKERAQEEALKISELHELLKPRMLRRMKSDVLSDCMPPKKWVEVPCSLMDPQRELYIDILEKNYQKLNEGIRGGKKVVLNHILMQLRKCCNHPYLFPGQEQCEQSQEAILSSLIASSGKLLLLQKLLPRLKQRGHRVLLFSQMTTMLDILEDFFVFLGLTYFRIDGSTSVSSRQQQVKDFNDPKRNVFAFLVSTRAGGLGIDLPTADRVIIYDPDFNPFMDLQAQSRAHRIGQTKPVVVYQLITKCSVEEKILEKSREKLAIENLVMNRKLKLDADELHSVLLHGARKILSNKYQHVTTIHYDDETVERLLSLEPALDEKCASEDNGYLGSIQSFIGGAEDAQASAPATAKDWEAVLGPVKVEAAMDLGRGKRQRKQVQYYSDDENDDDEIYSPESSSVSSTSEDSEHEGYCAESD